MAGPSSIPAGRHERPAFYAAHVLRAGALRVPLDDKNPPHTALAARSLKLDFSGSDMADERELNDILWIAIKGNNGLDSLTWHWQYSSYPDRSLTARKTEGWRRKNFSAEPARLAV